MDNKYYVHLKCILFKKLDFNMYFTLRKSKELEFMMYFLTLNCKN